MRTRRIALAAGVSVLAVAAIWLLIAALASAEVDGTATARASGPVQTSEEMALSVADDLASTQALSVTFPVGPWPPYAQQGIAVHPDPPIPGHPTELCAEVINHDASSPHTVTLEFMVAGFGIGVPFEPVGRVEVVVPPGGGSGGCVVWVPPDPGHWCIQAGILAEGNGEPLVSQRNIDIWESPIPGVPDVLPFDVGPFPESTVVTFAVRNVLDGWDVHVEPPRLSIEPSAPVLAELVVTPPLHTLLGTGRVIADVEGYIDGELIGGFRKIDAPPVPLHRARDPFFAESEISVSPYPPLAGEPTEVCVELRNLSDVPRTVAVQFSWANFGIGLPFHPIDGPVLAEIPPHASRRVCITWVPPFSGHFCVQVRLDTLPDPDLPVEYVPQFSQRNLDVGEPLEPGVEHVTELLVGNHFNEFTNPDPVTSTILLEADVHLPGWGVELIPPVLNDVLPGEERPVLLAVTPPDGELPPDRTPIVDVRARAIDPSGAERVIGGFRKIFRPPVPIHRPDEPPYGESEISIEPYPPRAGEPVHICTKVRNHTRVTQTVQVEFSVAGFGIGIPFVPVAPPFPVELPPYAEQELCVSHVFSYGGHFCVQIRIHAEGYPVVKSQRNLDVSEILKPNEPDRFEVPVGNPFDDPVTITLGLINHMPGWDVSLSPWVLTDVQPWPAPPIPVELWITPTEDVADLEDGVPVLDLEAYVGDELIGGIRKIFRPPTPIHRPGDPIYAESEITVHPYPPRAREPTELGVELYNPTDHDQVLTIAFSYANFGIGLPFHPVNGPFTATVPAHGMVRRTIMWLPPEAGLWCIQVEIELPDLDRTFHSQRNIDVGEPLVPGEPHSRRFWVGNPHTESMTITMGLIRRLPDWDFGLSPRVLTDVEPGGRRVVTLTVTPPGDRPLPEDGTVVVDVEAHARGMLVGGFRKIHRPPVPIHRPRDPVYAESEIGVDPYPAIPGEPTRLSVEVHNPTDQDRVVTATFSIAPFGIGLPFSTMFIAPNPVRIFVPAHGAARGHVIWRPPLRRGKFCVRVELEMGGHEPVWSQRNIDVGEPLRPGMPHKLTFDVGPGDHTGPVTVTLGLINHMPGWEASVSPAELAGVSEGHNVTATLTVTPPAEAELGTERPIVDVEAFVDGGLIGGFRKIDRPPVPLHKPHEKGYAETEIIVDPYPPQRYQPTRVSSVIQNSGEEPVTVTLEFGWAKFGLGIPFTTTGLTPPTRTVTVSPEATATATVTWMPQLSGPQCILIELTDADGRYGVQRSQRNVYVEERPPCGQTQVYSFTIANDTPLTVTVDIGLITFNVPLGWGVTTVPSDTLELAPFTEGVVSVTVEIPCSLRALQVQALQQEASSVPTIDVEGYIDGELRGGIEIQFAPEDTYPVYLPVVMRQWR